MSNRRNPTLTPDQSTVDSPSTSGSQYDTDNVGSLPGTHNGDSFRTAATVITSALGTGAAMRLGNGSLSTGATGGLLAGSLSTLCTAPAGTNPIPFAAAAVATSAALTLGRPPLEWLAAGAAAGGVASYLTSSSPGENARSAAQRPRDIELGEITGLLPGDQDSSPQSYGGTTSEGG